jgi:hypothetical protein
MFHIHIPLFHLIYNIFFKNKNGVLFCIDHEHVSAIHVIIFRVVTAKLQVHVQCVAINPHLQPYGFGLNSGEMVRP